MMEMQEEQAIQFYAHLTNICLKEKVIQNFMNRGMTRPQAYTAYRRAAKKQDAPLPEPTPQEITSAAHEVCADRTLVDKVVGRLIDAYQGQKDYAKFLEEQRLLCP